MRLRVVQHPAAGQITSPVVDSAMSWPQLASEADDSQIPAGVRLVLATASLTCTVPAGSSIRLECRTGSSPHFSPRHWTPFTEAAFRLEHAARLCSLTLQCPIEAAAGHRFCQIRLSLDSLDGISAPEIHGLTINSAVELAESQDSSARVLHCRQPEVLLRSSYPFRLSLIHISEPRDKRQSRMPSSA